MPRCSGRTPKLLQKFADFLKRRRHKEGITRRSTTNPTALVGRRLDWMRERDRSSESALSRSDWVC